MSFFPGNDPEPGDSFACDAIETLVVPKVSDIGGFEVRRALPSLKRKLVGPFIFFDRMGPATFRPGEAIDVRPHPHIGLSTVTYLYDGTIRHRDSLGTEMVIAPGDINLMTAGRGIVHSERSPEETRQTARRISGLQTWLALPDDKEEIAPSFENTDAASMGVLDGGKAQARVLIGSFHGVSSPVTQFSETLYVDVTLAPGGEIEIPADAEERAVYVVEGEIDIAGDIFAPDRLLVFRPGDRIVVRSERGASFMLFGGASLGSRRYIWWNFVSSSRERIEQAKEEWKSRCFDIVPGDEEEFIPLPE
ncbi:pirin family protein [Oricola thermophila]|uniref:Pirin family protein n=1 Tax=Oricola thermophila TaxID=2742145 RepID=A0A6N1VDC3_9HYPH|nr:pirin family protein [Oricola thermophila]QKV18900.1 pirin family protein [Oricola thermophila]